MNVTSRFLHPTADLPAISELWAAALGAAYPIGRGHLGGVLRACGFILGAEADGKLVGFTAATARSHAGSLAALVVAPRHRRLGIGGSLVDAALEHLAARDVAEVTLGEGGPYIWPGIPTDLRAAARFFLKRGWSPTGRHMDMVADTVALTVPERIARLVAAVDAQVRPGTSGDMEALLEFEQRNFPDWLPVAERYSAEGRAHDVCSWRSPAGSSSVAVSSAFPKAPTCAGGRSSERTLVHMAVWVFARKPAGSTSATRWPSGPERSCGNTGPHASISAGYFRGSGTRHWDSDRGGGT